MVEAQRTAWCSILMTRVRPGGSATNEGPADARGRHPTIAENASGAVAETETIQAGTSRGVLAIVIVTVTDMTGVKAVRQGILCKPYTDLSGCLIVHSLSSYHSITVRPKSDGWEGNAKGDPSAVSAAFRVTTSCAFGTQFGSVLNSAGTVYQPSMKCNKGR